MGINLTERCLLFSVDICCYSKKVEIDLEDIQIHMFLLSVTKWNLDYTFKRVNKFLNVKLNF